MNLLQPSITLLLLLLLLFAPLQLGLAVEAVPFPQSALELFLLHPPAVFVRACRGAYGNNTAFSLSSYGGKKKKKQRDCLRGIGERGKSSL